MTRGSRLLLALTLLCLSSLPALAEERSFFGKLGGMLSPGPLSKAHAYIDHTKGCTQCHSLNEGVTDQLCLDCHKEVQESFDQKKGLHGHLKKQEKCVRCHDEHEGRKHRIYKKSHVNHDKVGFSLEGKHLRVDCEKCHKDEFRSLKSIDLKIDGRRREGHSYTGLSADCGSCHTKNHGKQFLGQACTDCHNDLDWKLVKFEHDKDSEYPLVGKHKNVTCMACHKKTKASPDHIQFVGISHNCSTCHEDPHEKKKGLDCLMCHQPQDWEEHKKVVKYKKDFDHEKTSFPLQAMHRRVKCESCHEGTDYKLPLKKDCDTCHNEIKEIMLGKFVNHLGEQADVDPMYRTVKCVDCHDPKQERLIPTQVRKACVDCHNEAFGHLWDYRQQKLGRRYVKTKHLDEEERIKRLQKVHRFSDQLP